MTKASVIQPSFNGGEFTDLLKGQVGLAKRPEALKLCQNMLALKQGPVTRRGGTKFVNEAKSPSVDDTGFPSFISNDAILLMPFQYSTEDSYIIEAGDQYFRFYKNGEIVTESATDQLPSSISQANPCVVTYPGTDDYANGDHVYLYGIGGMYEVDKKIFRVSNVNTGSNTFELQDIYGNDIDSTEYNSYTNQGSVAKVYELASPYRSERNGSAIAQDLLFDSNGISKLNYIQSADVLYLTHQSYGTRTLTRSADDSWTLSTLIYEDGPYLEVNTTSTTLTLSAVSGSVNVTASSTTGINSGDGFLATDVGRIIRWKDPAGDWTWLTITALTSTTIVVATVSGPAASATTATVNWRLGLYSDTTGFPAHATFFQDRLCFGGGGYERAFTGAVLTVTDKYRKTPDRVDLSKTGGYGPTFVLMAPTEVDGAVSDDNAISKTLPSRQVNAIQWMASDSDGLLIGTTGQEWSLRASNLNEVITPSNARPEVLSTTGSSNIRPVQAESGLLFVQRARRKLFDMLYSIDVDRLKPRDLTLAAEHITKTQLVQLSYQQEPINVIWAIKEDGTLLGFTYYSDEKVFAWHRHIIGGFSDANGTIAKVTNIAVIPSSTGDRDELWLVVKRYINGRDRYYIEKMERYYEDDIDLKDNISTDSSYSFNATDINNITDTNIVRGLNYLEGETVSILLDGKSHNSLVVTDGKITLDDSKTGIKIQIGFPNTWAIQTLEANVGARDGTSQSKTKRIHNLSFKLLDTLGVKYGPNSTTLDEYIFSNYETYDETPVLFSGNTEMLPFNAGYEQEGQIYITNDGVFPVTILSLTYQLITQDR